MDREMDIGHPNYKRAFERYVRTGAEIPLLGPLAVKKERPTTHYIWRTRGDGKVRASHAANNGKIFAWAKPPATGHPGEDYGCRCIAIPFTPASTEHFSFALTNVTDNGPHWSSADFVRHYFFGGGQSIRVRDTGHLKAIVAEYRRLVLDDPKRLPTQIAKTARSEAKKNNGAFSETFEASYQMQNIAFSIGDTVIRGTYRGRNSESNGILYLRGSIEFHLRDKFRDPLDLETALGVLKQQIDPVISDILDQTNLFTDDIERVMDRVLSRLSGQLGTLGRGLRDYIIDLIRRELIYRQKPSYVRARKAFPELPGGTPYNIADDWGATFSAEVLLDDSKSQFPS